MKRFSIFLALAAVLVFSSCEIGLGSAVDTQPPTIVIENPPVDAVVRDNFSLSGTYDDDGTIASVKATLTRPDGKGSAYEFTEFTLTADALIKGAGKWSIPVAALSQDGKKLIADGTYLATINVKDAAGRLTTQNTTFTIDNTPPVIVLQRPGTDLEATISNADTYGQVFSLEGLGADDNNIDHIDVMVYADKDRTVLKHTVTLSNVPPSISLNVAEYGDDAYTAIYGNVAPADFAPAQYYCSIMAYDSAKRYPVEGQEAADDDKGNSTDVYYIYEKISKDVLKTTKITDVYRIVSAGETNDIITKLAQNEQHAGSFVLDPKNNPTYTLAGKPTLIAGNECLAEATDYTVPNDSDITIQASVGLDNSPIVDDASFKVYFQKAVFQNGKYVGTGTRIYPEIDPVNGKKKSGSNYQFTVKVKSSDNGLSVNNAYLIGIEGEDENGQPFLAANNGYGFYLLSMSSAPTLKEIVPPESTIYVKKGGSLTITGKTTLTEGSPVVSLRYGDTEWATTPALTEHVAGTTNEYAFELEVTADKFKSVSNNDANSTEIALEIRSSCGGKSSSTYKTILYDVDLPTVNELTVSPEITDPADHAGKYILNGEITVKALLEDVFTAVKQWHYEVWQGGVPIAESTPISSSKVEFTYDTTNLADRTDATIKIIVEDKAGNEYPKDIDCYVDQSTDKPSFESQDGVSWKTGILNPYYINEVANDENVAVKNIISGDIYSKVTDDDSVAFVRFDVQAIKLKSGVTDKTAGFTGGYDLDNVKQATLKNEQKSALYAKTGKEVSITHGMPNYSGFYLITQTVYDKNFVWSNTTTHPATDENTASNANYFRKDNYVVKIAGSGPQFLLSRNTNYISKNNKNKQLEVTITVEEGEPPYTVRRIINDVPTTLNGFTSGDKDSFLVSDIYPQDDTIYSVEYEISDSNGTTRKTITYTKDEDPPTFANTRIYADLTDYPVYEDKTDNIFYLNNKDGATFTISGQPNDLVGVDTATLTIVKSGETDPAKYYVKKSPTGYFDNISLDKTYWTGDATATITVTDNAGNTCATPVTLNLRFDTEAPAPVHMIDHSAKDLVVRIGDYKNDQGHTDVGGKYSFGTYGSALSIMLRGYFPDNEGGSGINKFYYRVFRNEVKIDGSKTYTSNGQPNGTPVDYIIDGHDIYFKSFDTLRDYVKANKDETFDPLPVNANYLNGIETKSVEYNVTPGQSDPFGGTKTNGDTPTDKGYIQYKKDVKSNYKTTIKGFQEGRNYLVLVAEDNVGNTRLDWVEAPTPDDPTTTAQYPCYSLNVDVTTPTISGDNAGQTKYVNVDSTNTDDAVKVNITGKVSDKPTTDDNGASGIKKIVFTSDASSAKVTVTIDSKDTDEQLAEKGIVKAPTAADCQEFLIFSANFF